MAFLAQVDDVEAFSVQLLYMRFLTLEAAFEQQLEQRIVEARALLESGSGHHVGRRPLATGEEIGEISGGEDEVLAVFAHSSEGWELQLRSVDQGSDTADAALLGGATQFKTI